MSMHTEPDPTRPAPTPTPTPPRRSTTFKVAVTLGVTVGVLVLLAATAGGMYLVMKPAHRTAAAATATASDVTAPAAKAAAAPATPEGAYLGDVHALYPDTARLADSRMVDMGQRICTILGEGGTPAMILKDGQDQLTVSIMVAAGTNLCPEQMMVVAEYRAQVAP